MVIILIKLFMFNVTLVVCPNPLVRNTWTKKFIESKINEIKKRQSIINEFDNNLLTEGRNQICSGTGLLFHRYFFFPDLW
jgi:hypothetical protein